VTSTANQDNPLMDGSERPAFMGMYSQAGGATRIEPAGYWLAMTPKAD
jgi:hypothetical protein